MEDKAVANYPWNSIGLQLAVQGDFSNARELFELQKYFESDDGKRLLLNLGRVQTYPELHAELISMKWAFYLASAETFFVSSNSPVIYQRLDVRHPILIFPIASNIVLFAKSNGLIDLQYIDVSSEVAFAINFMFIRLTSSVPSAEIYASKAERWVWEIFNHSLGLDENQELAWRKLIAEQIIAG